MKEESPTIQRDRDLITSARAKGRASLFGAFIKLSGPGWLQSAITLGGGSLANALYLGVLGGFAFLWLQPLAMIMGVIMLSAIGYVTLSTGESPFRAINKHVNPVLGWGWIIATLLANCVWSLPQFNLATAATRQNLMPGLLGDSAMSANSAATIICVVIAVICTLFVWSYDSGKKGIKVFDIMLKVIVGLIVLSFFGVVVKLSTGESKLQWGEVLAGLVPNLNLLSEPAVTFTPYLDAVDESFRSFWKDVIVSQQRDVMIGAAATAVGINMTFLMPYSLLKRGWNRDFRGLAIFDLATGLFIPFILVTGCVVIVSASQFHTRPEPGLLGEKDANGQAVEAAAGAVGQFNGLLKKRLAAEMDGEALAALSPEQLGAQMVALPLADRTMAAMLVKRDSGQLALSLEPLTGKKTANFVFGFGVVGMAVSSIIILMLINGFVMCEILRKPMHGWTYRLGSLMPLVGILGPFVWKGGARFWLAVPTSVFGMVLLPVAYFSFFMMMNAKSLLGKDAPQGMKRIVWNVSMAIAAGLASFGSIYSVWSKRAITKGWSLYGMGAFIALAIIVQIVRRLKKGTTA